MFYKKIRKTRIRCSPYQVMRKAFCYMEFGLFPECYGEPASEMHHDSVSEYFGSLHHTVIEDNNWQNEESEEHRRLEKIEG